MIFLQPSAITLEPKISAGIFLRDFPKDPTAVLTADVIKISFIKGSNYLKFSVLLNAITTANIIKK